ncbi:MAG: PDZ domain-containing protein, partial [Gemmataceae bacterium]
MRHLARLRWPLLGLLTVTMLAVPGRADNPPPAAIDPAKIAELEKQIAEMQKKLSELKGTVPATTTPTAATIEGTIPDSALSQYKWRGVGPANMGGRVTALSVYEKDPSIYFVATGGGGLLKTINNGTTFTHLFDKQSTVAIGDVAVCQSNPELVWVGTGEANPRNSVSYGDGVYKSIDGGKTWTNMGLKKSFQIGKILIHPKNPDVVFVGALGRLYGANEERGVFKTTDGGKTWTKIFFIDDKTGIIDMVMDPTDPDTIIAGAWERKRDEFDGFFGDAPVPDSYGPIVTHGAGGGLHKTTDGGKTWKKLSSGLPTVKTGRIGFDYSRKTKGLVVAIIDTEKVGTGEAQRPVYLGITGESVENNGGAKLLEITADGPAAKAGLKDNDIVTKADDKKIEAYDQLIDIVRTKKAGDKIKLTITREKKEQVIEVTLANRPGTETPTRGGAALTPARPTVGVTFEGATTKIAALAAGGGAEKAGIKAGDTIVSIQETAVKSPEEMRAAIGTSRKEGDVIDVGYEREGKKFTTKVTLGAPQAALSTIPPTPMAGGGRRPAATRPLPGFFPELNFQATELKIGIVEKDSAAEKAGVKVGDMILEVDGKKLEGFRDFLTALRTGQNEDNPRKAGDKVKVKIKSGEKTLDLELALIDMAVQGPGGGPNRGASATKPYALGLGGQQPNVQDQQGKDSFQTGGVFESRDNGETWKRINSLNPRPMYFSVVRIDPNDDKTLYVLCDTASPIYRSVDGGKRFENMATARGVHADAHALWINPANSKNLIIGCDGGFYSTYDKGATWEHLNHFALGQFYHVAVDNRKPYRIYGGLQDNGSWGGPSNTKRSYGPINEDWGFVNGGDGFVCRVDPNDPDLVYTESQGGAMARRNLRTGERGFIRPAGKQGDPPFRFNWNTPYILSNANSSIFYCAGEYVFKSIKRGADLKKISPDITRTKAGSATALGESPLNPDVLWVGTDDGFLWVTKDGGVNWNNVSDALKAAGLPGYRYIATVEPSRDKEGRCYVTIDAHRSDDDKPYIFMTEDLGKTFKLITSNLPAFGSTRVCREDITNANLLYAGTEFGAFVSANRGASWSKLGEGLPTVACHEFAQPTT